MSYVADHLAWQQRVAQEFKAQTAAQDTSDVINTQGQQWFTYPDLIE